MRPTATLAAISLLVVLAACATVPPPPPVPGYEQKLAWILRLEDQRVLRDPTPPAVPPTPPGQRVTTAPRPVPDLITLLGDEQARVRRRAALAVGRVGLSAGVEPLAALLHDADPEVRQMAAFALGLIGDAAAVPALRDALADPSPIVQGRAAEALGNLGAGDHAAVIADMARPWAGSLAAIAPDDLTYPMTPEVEAVRLALYALARLKAFEPLASLVLDGSGRPVSGWWPVAYALRRVEDPRAAVALRDLLGSEGRFSRGFAARGLGVLRVEDAVADLSRLAADVAREPAVAVEAVRALGEIRAAAAVPALVQVLKTPSVHPGIRAETVTAIGRCGDGEDAELLLDLLNDRDPQLRASTYGALAALDSERLLIALSSLDPDPEWRVRAAAATALGTLPAERAAGLLAPALKDSDARVRQAALAAVASAGAPEAPSLLLEALGSEHAGVRRAAAEGLGALKHGEALDALRAAYDDASRDGDHTTRAAIVSAMARVGGAAAAPVLAPALQDKDWAVRVRAANLLRDIDPGRDAPAEAIRPAPSRLDGRTYESPAIVSPRYSTHVYIDTDRGTIEVELAVLDAPLTVHNFVSLARQGVFDGAPVHRVVPAFVVQDGDPDGDGAGGPGWTIRDEINQRPYLRGTVGMALDGRDSGGSQFFVTHGPQPHLDGRYTAFGQVVDGMEVVDRLQQGDVIRAVRVWDGS